MAPQNNISLNIEKTSFVKYESASLCLGDRRVGDREKGGVMWEKRGWEEGIPRRREILNISLHFAKEMGQTGGSHYGKGREAGEKGTGSERFGFPLPPTHQLGQSERIKQLTTFRALAHKIIYLINTSTLIRNIQLRATDLETIIKRK